MHLVPTNEEVIRLLRETGALRHGHFRHPDGLHSDEYLQVPLAMRYYQHQKTLSVGLSRLVRANPEIRAVVSELSIVAPSTGGLPVAYTLCEALRARQVYWAERRNRNEALRYRPFLEQEPGEKVLLVDDILRTGERLTELKAMMEARGEEVVGIAVIVYQPNPRTGQFGSLPLYYLAKLEGGRFGDDGSCELCRQGIPVQDVWV